ncbi:hypothetical protein ACC685_37480, partial [Rhizobium ruizarguesonis]
PLDRNHGARMQQQRLAIAGHHHLMGVARQQLAPSGLKEIAAGRLPVLEDVEFVLVPRKGADQELVSALSEDILQKVRGLRST